MAIAKMDKILVFALASLTTAHGAGILGDAVALVQQRDGSRASRTSVAAGRFGSTLSSSRGLPHGVTCEDIPEACTEPFNCNLHTHMTMYNDMTYTTNGHANPNSWCHTPYLKYGLQCIKEGNMTKAAHTLFSVQTDKVKEMDAQYCFAAGHCNKTSVDPSRFKAFDRSQVTEHTTLLEAEGMCDAIYGEKWKHMGILKYFGMKPDGFGKKNEFAKLACAMGNWHCDVIYCREFYCEDEYWVKRYGYKAIYGATQEDS